MTKKRLLLFLFMIAVILISSVGCTVSEEEVKNNQIVQSWLEDNMESTDSYKLTIDLVTSYNEYDKEKPENIPETIAEGYEIHILKNEAKAKIVTLSLTEETLYLSIENDIVYIYRSTDDGFLKEFYYNAQLAEALAAIIFPDDVSIFNGEVVRFGTTGKSSLSLKTFNVQRLVDSKPFYLPYNLITGRQEEKNALSLNFSYNMDADTMLSLSMLNIEDFYKTMHFIFSGFEYENIYTQNNIEYDQQLTIYFSDMDQAEEFELPKIDE